MAAVTYPGERLGHAADLSAGEGSFAWGEHLYASRVGACAVGADGRAAVARAGAPAAPVPAVGDRCVCRVTRINPRMASVEILVVGGAPLREPCAGLLRREDVAAPHAAGVAGLPEVYRSFRPGDLVLAQVTSLGDARSYYLTTADVDLGVVLARSAAGAPMLPLSFEEMECPLTGATEPRKVAKPPDTGAAPPTDEAPAPADAPAAAGGDAAQPP